MKKPDILQLFRTKNTILTFKDISLIWGETDSNLVKSRINYHVKNKNLYQIRRGIYSKDKDYNKFELASKIFTPSYISLETVLYKEGIIFQFYKNIHAVSYLNREIICGKQKYTYKKIKDSILNDPEGLEDKETYFMASKERAFLDILYLYKESYFDNLKSINWDFCFELAKIYENKSLIKRMNTHYARYKNS